MNLEKGENLWKGDNLEKGDNFKKGDNACPERSRRSYCRLFNIEKYREKFKSKYDSPQYIVPQFKWPARNAKRSFGGQAEIIPFSFG